MVGELTNSEIEFVLYDNVIGRIGCHAFGRTYVVPITYAYDGERVVVHSRDGMKLHMMRENPHVCFEVDTMDGSGNWESVIASGTFEELRGEAARKRFDWLVDRLALRLGGPPGETVHPTSGLQTGHVFEIVLENKSGRFERRL